MYEDIIFEKWFKKISDYFEKEMIDLEKIRKKEKKENLSRLIKSILILLGSLSIIFIILGLIMLIRPDLNITLVFFLAIFIIIAIIILPILAVSILTNYEKSFEKKIAIKKSIIDIIINSFNKNIKYSPQEGIAPAIYSNASVEPYDSYYSSQLMTCQISNACILLMAETTALYKHSNIINDYDFIGTFAVLNTPKPFTESLYIKREMRNGKNDIATKLPYKDMRIELDSQEFEGKFDVYSSNKIIALQLLTSDILLLLNEFYDYIKKNFEIIIKNDTIYIRVWNGISFSNSLIKDNKLDKELIYNNYKTINFIFNISTKLIEVMNETPYL